MSRGEAVVRAFWAAMGTNDFRSVIPLLHPEFLLEWPQSGERIRGPERFAQMNAEYPTSGRWSFDVERLVASGDEVVTWVRVTDGTLSGTPVSFFTLRDGQIAHLLEFWPDPFPPAPGRRHLVEP